MLLFELTVRGTSEEDAICFRTEHKTARRNRTLPHLVLYWTVPSVYLTLSVRAEALLVLIHCEPIIRSRLKSGPSIG